MTAAFIGALLLLAGGSSGGGRTGIGEVIAMTIVFILSIAIIMSWAYAPFYILLWFPKGNIVWVGPVWWIGTLLLNKYIADRVHPLR